MGANLDQMFGDIYEDNREQILSEIKEIITDYGTFGTGEIEAPYSPSVPNQKGNLIHSLFYFNLKYAEVLVWSEALEQEVDDYSLPYNELDTETLAEILELCQAWQELNQEEED